MTATSSASPNLNGTQQPPAAVAQPQTDASSASGSTVQPSAAGAAPDAAQQQQQAAGAQQPHVQAVQYAPHQYPMMPAPMAVYQGYPGTHPGAYMAAAPHFAPPGSYPMYPAGGAGGAPGSQQQGNAGKARGMSPTSSMHSGQGGNGGAGSMVDRPKTTLWMGIDSWMDENYIRSLWMNAAGVEVTVKMIRDRYTGGTANYCFVDFPTPEHAANCAKFDGTPIPTLPESTWRLNWAAGGGLNDTKAPEYSIFVGDLAADISDDALMAAFKARYPSTKTAKVVMDPGTGNSRGFGFVRFTAEDEQQRALSEMTGQLIGSRAVRVGHAAPKHAHRHQNNHSNAHHGGVGPNTHHGGPQGHQHHQHHHGGRGGHFNNHHHNQHHHQQGGWNNNPNNQANAAAAAAAAAADPNNTTVFIGGLSHPVTEDEIRSMFSALGEITLVKIPHNKNCAFVSYARRDSAEKAIAELNGFPLGNNKVRLSWGRPNANNNAPGGAGAPHHQQGHHHHHQGHYGQPQQAFQQGPPGAGQGAPGYAGNASYAAAGQFGATSGGFAPSGFPNAGPAPGYVADGQAAAGGAPGYYPGYYNGAAPAGGAGAPAPGAAREGGVEGNAAATANGEGTWGAPTGYMS